MDKIFLSAVTKEFGSTRRLIEPIVRRLGYEPVSMDNWTTAEGELITWLRQQLDVSSVTKYDGAKYLANLPKATRPTFGFVEARELHPIM